MDVKHLVEKWEKVLDEGTKIKNPKIKKATALMLENQHTYLTEAGMITQDGLTRSGSGYAESGDFDNAIKWIEKAIELAPGKEKSDYRFYLDLYKQGKPYRE